MVLARASSRPYGTWVYKPLASHADLLQVVTYRSNFIFACSYGRTLCSTYVTANKSLMQQVHADFKH